MSLVKSIELAVRRGFIHSLRRIARRTGGAKKIPERAKLLFLRQDRIGDLLISTAIIHALAKEKPLWRLDILCGRSNVDILENDPVLTKRWFYDKKIGNTIKLISRLRRERYDVVIDLMDNPSATSTALLALIGGAVNVGLQKDNGFVYDIAVPMRSRTDSHIVQRLADIIRALGGATRDDELRLSYTPGEHSRTRAKEYFSSFKQSGKKICCINTSAGAIERFWGIEQYRALLSQAVATFPNILFFIAAQPQDMTRAKEICAGNNEIHLLPASSSFDEFAGMVEQADIVISPDTSVVHLASALGKPTVALFANEANAINWSPYGVPFRDVISRDDSMQSISAGDVVNAFGSLLKEIN